MRLVLLLDDAATEDGAADDSNDADDAVGDGIHTKSFAGAAKAREGGVADFDASGLIIGTESTVDVDNAATAAADGTGRSASG